MTSIRNLLAGTVLAAGALLSATALLAPGAALSMPAAADEPGTPGDAPGEPGRWHHHHHGQAFLYSKLGLTDAQKASIKSIMQANGPQLKTLHEQLRSNSLKLWQTQPNDPNYANVVSQTAAANAALHQQIDTFAGTIRQEIFATLTPAQQAQLQTLQSQMAARRAAHASAAEPAGT